LKTPRLVCPLLLATRDGWLSAGLVLKPEAISQLVSCLLYPAEQAPATPPIQYGSGLTQAFHVGDILQVLSGENTYFELGLETPQHLVADFNTLPQPSLP